MILSFLTPHACRIGLFYRNSGRFICGLALALAAPSSVQAAPVLLISIDGLRAGELREAADRQLKLPNLAGIFAQGAHAEGVIGVLPSFTLPSHVTLLTGVSPAKHGVYNNLAFLPQNAGGAPGLGLGSAIKAQTLWEAAHSAGLRTLSVNWPVSLGARGLDFNISGNFVAPGSTQDDDRFNRLLSTPGLADRLEREIGPIRLVTRHGGRGRPRMKRSRCG